MAIRKYDPGWAIGPPARSKNDNREGGGDLHRPVSFRNRQPEQADPDKVQRPSDMVSSRFPNTIFLGHYFPDLAFQPGLL